VSTPNAGPEQPPSPEELQADIVATRAELADTVRQLSAKLDVKSRARQQKDKLQRLLQERKRNWDSRRHAQGAAHARPQARRGYGTMDLPKKLDELVGRIEHASSLDRAANAVAKVVGPALRPTAVRDVASGAAIGHPLHPVLVAGPIGSWLAASYLDLFGRAASRHAARKLVGLGTVLAVPTAATGLRDWLDTSGAERRVGVVHAAFNVTAVSAYAASWLARGRGRSVKGIALSLLGLGTVVVSGWLGGHLAYALGVGVDTTAFQQLPQDWTDVGGESAVGASPRLVYAAGVPVLLVRHDGRIVALVDRCSHRGGPLHEGELVDGCVKCPWHGSVFALADGSVVHGPATRPEPTFEVRVVSGQVQVRRVAEVRSLRTAPIGP
jgi:nitrite reductase/ring-hydroxylating ferredoxin subunit/uncharacterized membrane protein